MTTSEKIIVVGTTILVCFLLLFMVKAVYGSDLNPSRQSNTFYGKEFTITFPGKFVEKRGSVSSLYGDVQIEEASYTADGIWLHARHAVIPPEMIITQTSEDIALGMLAPIEDVSKRSIAHMKLQRLGIIGTKASGEIFFTHFMKDGCRFFCGIFVIPGHAWAISTMDCGDRHPDMIKAFLGSIRIPRIDGAARGEK